MKKTLFLLSTVCCIALPAVSQADDLRSPSARTTSATAKAGRAAATATSTAPARQKMVIYITDRPRTGSQIPMTYRQYDGRIDSASSPAVYGADALRFTGSEDVGTSLYRLDPSIRLTRGR